MNGEIAAKIFTLFTYFIISNFDFDRKVLKSHGCTIPPKIGSINPGMSVSLQCFQFYAIMGFKQGIAGEKTKPALLNSLASDVLQIEVQCSDNMTLYNFA